MRGISKRLVATVLILFVVPLCAGAALGYEMSGNRIDSIPTAVIDHDNSEFSRELLNYIGQSDIFNVTYSASTDSEIEQLIFEGKIYVGVIIPEGMYQGMLAGNAPEAMVVYDGAYMIVAAGARAAMSEIIQTVRAGYLLKVYEGKLGISEAEALKMLKPYEPVYRILYNPARDYRNFFLPGLITAIIQVGIVIVGLERAKEENLCGFKRDAVKILETGLIGSLSIAVNMAAQFCFFGMPFRGSVLAFAVLTLLFSLCMAAFGYLFGKAIPDKLLSTQIACLFVLPAAILGGYTYPLMAMPDFFHILRMIIPLSYYGEDLRNLTLKELDLTHFTSNMLYYIVFLCVELFFIYVIVAIFRRGERRHGNA